MFISGKNVWFSILQQGTATRTFFPEMGKEESWQHLTQPPLHALVDCQRNVKHVQEFYKGMQRSAAWCQL